MPITEGNPLILNNTSIGSGEPLILLHGLFGMGSNLSMIARAMEPWFTVHSLDLRNHGQSLRDKSMTLAQMAADVSATMDHLGISSAHLLGHSLGGKVAMELAITDSSRVNKLIAADISPVQYPDGGHEHIFKGLKAVDLNQVESRSHAQRILAEHIEEPGVIAFLAKSLYRNEAGKFDWRFNLQSLENNYENLRSAASCASVFSGPVLFIKGGNSDYILESHTKEIQRRFNNISFKMIQNTGHWLHAEKPVAFNNVIKQFLVD